MKKIFLLYLLTMFFIAPPAQALHPDEVLADPVLEQRARELTRQVRCLVCRGEAIDESNAPLAADLRRLVRARLMAGDTDQQVKNYLTARYGDYILMRPPLGLHTVFLWVMPFAIFGLGGFIVWRRQRRAADGAGI